MKKELLLLCPGVGERRIILYKFSEIQSLFPNKGHRQTVYTLCNHFIINKKNFINKKQQSSFCYIQ